MARKRTSFEEDYRKKVVIPEDAGECWEWGGSRTVGGYAIVHNGRRQMYAHRLSYEIHNGPIPDGLWVLHRCDNPPCTNPAHLFAGTAADNALDREQKGRGARNIPPTKRGSANYRAKLTESDVVKIRQAYASGGIFQKALANQFGVDQSIISEIITRKRWAHVGEASE